MRNAQWEMYRPTPGPSRAGFSTLIHYYQGRGKTGNTEHGTRNREHELHYLSIFAITQ